MAKTHVLLLKINPKMYIKDNFLLLKLAILALALTNTGYLHNAPLMGKFKGNPNRLCNMK